MVFKKRRIFDLRVVQSQQQLEKPTDGHRSSRSDATLSVPSRIHSRRRWKLYQLKLIRNWFTESLRNYCQTTSLHGFSYITRQDISRNERCFWLFIVLAAIIASISLVLVSLYANRQTPTVTVIESSHFPTWNIPFPAVSICNFNKISKTKALSLLKNM